MTKLTKAKPTRRGTRLAKPQRRLLRGLTERVVWHAVDDLKPFPGNPRRHPESQIAGLMKSIGKVWTNPILIDESLMILAGHGRLEAAKRLGMREVPTVTITGLSPGEKRAILIADNRLPKPAPMHPSPSACQFRLPLNGLATSELRRMFWDFGDEGACVTGNPLPRLGVTIASQAIRATRPRVRRSR